MSPQRERSAQYSSDREILSSRIIDAPRERVFQAWTDPDQLAQWWGPKGFTNTFHEFDLKPSGNWRFIMHGPDGTNYNNHSVFEEIVEPERLTFRHESPPRFDVIVTFAEKAGKTLLTWRMIFKSKEECDKIKMYAVAGNLQNLDKLEAHLAQRKGD